MTDQNPFQITPGNEQPAQPTTETNPPQPQYGAYSQTGQQTPSSQAPYAGQGVNATQVPPVPHAGVAYSQTGQYTQAAQFPQGNPMTPMTQKLPGRGGAIATLVIGLITMFIIAPIALFIGAITGAVSGIDSESVHVGTAGTVSVTVVSETPDLVHCEITDGANHYPLILDGNGLFSAEGVPAGVYDVGCDGLGPQDVVIPLTDDIITGALTGIGISLIIGLVGLVLTIIGIVWLVKVNKRRRAMIQPRTW